MLQFGEHSVFLLVIAVSLIGKPSDLLDHLDTSPGHCLKGGFDVFGGTLGLQSYLPGRHMTGPLETHPLKQHLLRRYDWSPSNVDS